MSSSFNLTLDTTGPFVEINTPVASPYNTNINIDIKINEPITNRMTLCLIDKANNVFDYILSITEEGLQGVIGLQGVVPGICFLNVQVEDVVSNKSALYQQAIRVYDSNGYVIANLTGNFKLSILGKIIEGAQTTGFNEAGDLLVKGHVIQGNQGLSFNKDGDLIINQVVRDPEIS